jgi:uroporphyrinogen-III synthase
MAEPKTRILSTRPLEAALLEQAAGRGIIIDTLSFIETEPLVNEALQQQIRDLSRQPLVAVFTSMNAVSAVAGWLKLTPGKTGLAKEGPEVLGRAAERPDWKIFCIGSATQQLVRENFGDDCIAGTAVAAATLAGTIISQTEQPVGAAGKGAAPLREVFFFCGDQRRDELPEKLQQQGIRVNELVVYKTTRTPHKVEQTYDGIAFFSPSAVHSFFQVNTIPAGTLLFAIGQTTADTIRAYSSNQTVLSGSPEKEALIRQVIDHFQGHQNSDKQQQTINPAPGTGTLL